MESGIYLYQDEVKTWGQLKKALESLGIKDEDKIDFIDFPGLGSGLTLEVSKISKEFSVT